ncbi:hypothetical protein AL036_20465 [Salipiger aestuarii]|nr:hypothetical protein [Salipiger aestuarii]KAA8605155.1 hypothetical protein AL036_20465 [Salipiger aestuarii]KAA8607191.1 hypothetical protein AL037_19255 [Salipiger aestuarii]
MPMPTASARSAWPFRAIGQPSKVVTTELGMRNRIAVTSRPEMPPAYSPISSVIAEIGSM